MSLNARAMLGFLLSGLADMSILFDHEAALVIPSIVTLLILAVLWWQHSKDGAWATWILGFLMAAGTLVSIGLGTALWAVLVLVSFGEPPLSDDATIRMLEVFRTVCYLAALALVIFELRRRASCSADEPGRSGDESS